MKFHVGDRVERLEDVYDQTSLLLHGEVIEVYSYTSQRFGFYPEMYKVKWDNEKIEKGFLPHGLDLTAN